MAYGPMFNSTVPGTITGGPTFLGISLAYWIVYIIIAIIVYYLVYRWWKNRGGGY